MSTFKLSPQIDKNKVFLIKRSQLEGRLDIDFYRPHIRALEKIIRSKSSKKLSDFIVKMASGATPSVTEEAKYYSDAHNGVPFLRVQNLSISGILDLDNLRFINQETHNNYLKRSQVNEGDLLVKITGVGRMAIGSVAPKKFIGNTNQHMVVIKTKSLEQSWYLANYLNLDIIEALATRRSTGGTRPALDYSALRSIPIIEGLDFSILKQAEQLKQQKQQQALALLASIDGYLLNELGITLPEQDNRLEKRIFRVRAREVSGGRLDPRYYLAYFIQFYNSISNKFNSNKLSEISSYIGSGATPKAGGEDYTTDQKEGVPFIRVTDFKHNTISLKKPLFIKRQIHEGMLKRTQLKKDDVLISIAGTIGESVVVPATIREANINQAIAKIEIMPESISPIFLSEVINSSIGKFQTDRLARPAVQANLNLQELGKLQVPLPPLHKQTEIVTHIQAIRTQAAQLQAEAEQILRDAKVQVEQMILGDSES